MRILVMSDSHSTMRYMRLAIDTLKPEAVIHLGDHYDNAETLEEEYSHIRFHKLPGNCDRYRCPPDTLQILCYCIGGVKFYMTHGHMHAVKSGLYRLIADARAMNAQAVLYGHTHIADCHQEVDLWVINPGACNSGEGSVALIETAENTIRGCTILQLNDLEEKQ